MDQDTPTPKEWILLSSADDVVGVRTCFGGNVEEVKTICLHKYERFNSDPGATRVVYVVYEEWLLPRLPVRDKCFWTLGVPGVSNK